MKNTIEYVTNYPHQKKINRIAFIGSFFRTIGKDTIEAELYNVLKM